MRNTAFTLTELINHLTNQVIVADAEMQLKQAALWRNMQNHQPYFDGESHLKFLGLDELKLSVTLNPYKLSWYNRFISLFNKKKRLPNYVIAGKGAFTLTVSLTRTIQNKYVKEVHFSENNNLLINYL